MSKIPLLTCDHWKNDIQMKDYPTTAIGFCVSEKLIVLFGFLTWIAVMQQIYVYKRIYNVPSSDKRLVIMLICWFSTLFTWCRYSFFDTEQKGSTFFFVEIFRFIIFFFVCYYFCDRASSLLPNKEQIKTGLQIFFNLSFVLSLALSIWIYVQILKGEKGADAGIQSNLLCKSWAFQLFRWFSVVLSAIFGSLFCMIKKRSANIPQETKMDKLNAAIQNNTLKRLGTAISWFFMMSLFSAFTDILSLINGDDANCNTSVFPKSVYFLNAVMYLMLRWISSSSAVWVALYLFYKSQVKTNTLKNIKPGKAKASEKQSLVGRQSSDLNTSTNGNTNDESLEDGEGSFMEKSPEEEFVDGEQAQLEYSGHLNQFGGHIAEGDGEQEHPDYQALIDRKETLRMINNRVGQGTVKLKRADAEREVDVSQQIDHGRESERIGDNRNRTSSVIDKERRFRGSVESNPINEDSYDQKLDDSMNSDMYMQRNDQSRDDEYD